MRAFFSVLLITALMAIAAPAGAGSATNAPANAPLAPGKPAGAAPAQSVTTVSSVVLGAGAFLGALLALQSKGAQKLTPDAQNNTPAASTTAP